MHVVLLLAGLGGLWLGTELTIRGATAVARIHRIPEFVVGVVILSLGSDLPELAIAINGAVRNLSSPTLGSDLITGSAVGSALGQFGLVLGVAGLVGYLTLPRKRVVRHGLFVLASILLLWAAGVDGHISRSDGASLVLVYLVYLGFVLTTSNRPPGGETVHHEKGAQRHWLLLLFGLAAVVAAAELTVRSATGIATKFGIEQSLLAVVVIGLGSSLPELSISVAAAINKKGGLSIGNLVGSNIFDTLVPVGIAAMIVPLRVDQVLLRYDIPFLFILSTLVLAFLYRKRGLQAHEALIILLAYFGYLAIRVNL